MTPTEIEAKLLDLDAGIFEAIQAVRIFISNKHPTLKQIYKWNCLMWESDITLVLGLSPLKNGIKVCFFNVLIPSVAFDATQRWGSTHTSHNLIFVPPASLNLQIIDGLLKG